MAEKKLNLLADFPAISTQEWMDKITADLKGADFAKKLIWRTTEGFDVMPFYRAEDIEALQTKNSAPGKFPFVRGTKTNNEWLVRQNINASCAKTANAKALEVLQKGVDSLGFKLNKKELSADYIATLLNNICAECVELNFTVCIKSCAELLQLLADYFAKKGYDLSSLRGSINCDPLNRMLLKGKKLSSETVSEVIANVVEAGKALPKYRVLGVNAVSLNNAGAYCTQELGFALAWGAQYMTLLTEAGVSAAKAAKAIKFNFGVAGNYFMEMAKFRAARWLWAEIVKAYEPICDCGASCTCEKVDGKYCPCAMKMKLHAETSVFNKTIFDAHVNMLRTQTEAMSATLGGVDSLTVNPFDLTYQAAGDFSERIARNQQLLLKEESHFDKVVDPAAGSYYIENLTNNIASEAWTLFLDIQAKGGFFAAVESGEVQQTLKATSAKRLKDVSARKEILLGTNQFPNFSEMASEKISKEACGCKCGCSTETGVDALPTARAAEEFEALRLATEGASKRPKAFMLTIGNLAMRLARAQFSCNFFACAGYEVIDNLGFDTVEAGVEAAQKAGADIIVLCSSDDEYAELAPKAFAAIAGKQEFVVAGAPACMDELKAIGIENFIHVRVNVLDTLKAFNEKLIK